MQCRTFFKQYCRKLQRTPKLNKCDKPIYAANDTIINSIGYFYATISNQFKSVKSTIYVMNRENEEAPLMSRFDLFTLGYLKIYLSGKFAAKKITEDSDDMSDEEFKNELAAIHKEFAEVFVGEINNEILDNYYRFTSSRYISWILSTSSVEQLFVNEIKLV